MGSLKKDILVWLLARHQAQLVLHLQLLLVETPDDKTDWPATLPPLPSPHAGVHLCPALDFCRGSTMHHPHAPGHLSAARHLAADPVGDILPLPHEVRGGSAEDKQVPEELFQHPQVAAANWLGWQSLSQPRPNL